MNDIFKLFLRKFVLLFFDYIFVYSGDPRAHLLIVLDGLRTNVLSVNAKKCCFFLPAVGITRFKVIYVDPVKIKVMQEWPCPKDPKGLCGFLGLTGYYRKTVSNGVRKPSRITRLFLGVNRVSSAETNPSSLVKPKWAANSPKSFNAFACPILNSNPRPWLS